MKCCTLVLMLRRSSHNPIIKAQLDLSWCSKKVYNCAVYSEGTTYHMLFRGVGVDWISRLGLAESVDGIGYTIDQLPVMSPQNDFEISGVEDPRMVKIGGTFYVTYTAYDGVTARAAMTTSTDLRNWGDRQIIFPKWNTRQQRENLPSDWSKAAALFPHKINDKYYLFFGDNHIWAAESDNLSDWEPMYEPILSARADKFDSAYVEMGPPPIHTDRGWLVLYHGIDRLDEHRTYRLGAALFDLNDPLKLIWRCDKPILEPEEPYEVMGLIDLISGGYETLRKLQIEDLQELADINQLPKAIFCCSAILQDDILRLYYSGSDTVICEATIDLESIFST